MPESDEKRNQWKDDDDEQGHNQPATSSFDDTTTTNNKTATTSSSDPTATIDLRSLVGSSTVQVSDTINSNLIVARYAAYAGIGLLATYGLIHSPLFFRYRTVSDIPSKHFVNRKILRCRLIDAASDYVGQSSSSSRGDVGPIRVKVRHLSLFERYVLISPSWFDSWMKLHPSQCRPDHNTQELLTVELAGVCAPPPYDSHHDQSTTGGEASETTWLQSWARHNKPLVTVQLLARRRQIITTGTHPDHVDKRFDATIIDSSTTHTSSLKKRRIPGLELINDSTPTSLRDRDDAHELSSEEQVAVAKITYRTKWTQLVSTDLALHLVQSGRATASSDDGLYPPLPGTSKNDNESDSPKPNSTIVDANRSVSTLHQDASYLTKLAAAEYDAARGHYGMWSDPIVRQQRADVMEEVEFQQQAPLWKKLWRWIRGG